LRRKRHDTITGRGGLVFEYEPIRRTSAAWLRARSYFGAVERSRPLGGLSPGLCSISVAPAQMHRSDLTEG